MSETDKLLEVATNLCQFYFNQGSAPWLGNAEMTSFSKVVTINQSSHRSIHYQIGIKKDGSTNATCTLRIGSQSMAVVFLPDTPELRARVTHIVNEARNERLANWLEALPGYKGLHIPFNKKE